MLQQLQDIFGSRIKSLEALYLLKDLKPVMRQCFYPNEIPKIQIFCEKNRLFMEKSPYKVIIESKDKFSNEGKIVLADSSHGMFIVYISKDHYKALWACLHETKQDHVNTGLMLGYPDCCAKFFMEEFSKGNLNPVHTPTNPWTNLTLRNDDIVLLSHFPCSSECEKSIEMAKQNFNLIKKYDPTVAELFLTKLTSKQTSPNLATL